MIWNRSSLLRATGTIAGASPPHLCPPARCTRRTQPSTRRTPRTRHGHGHHARFFSTGSVHPLARADEGREHDGSVSRAGWRQLGLRRAARRGARLALEPVAHSSSHTLALVCDPFFQVASSLLLNVVNDAQTRLRPLRGRRALARIRRTHVHGGRTRPSARSRRRGRRTRGRRMGIPPLSCRRRADFTCSRGCS